MDCAKWEGQRRHIKFMTLLALFHYKIYYQNRIKFVKIYTYKLGYVILALQYFHHLREATPC
jgi:hypothetical protein